MGRLAVYAPDIGTISETFIRRHVQDLLPGNAVAISLRPITGPPAWQAPCPTHYMLARRPPLRDLIRCKLGIDPVPGLSGILRFLEEHQVEAILGEYLNSSHPLFLATRKRGYRFYPHAHGFDISACLREAEWRRKYRDFNEADGVITMSAHSKALLAGLGVEPRRIHVIPYGVDVPGKPPAPRSPDGEVRCLAVGRMVLKKAPLVTLEAFRIASEGNPALRLDFVGGGRLFDDVARRVRDAGLAEKVRLHGPVEHAATMALLRQADIFLQHSIVDPESGDTEGLPVGILEAMAHGVPVISTRHAGIPEAVEDGGTGYLVDEGDGEGMAERLVRLGKDADLRRAMGEAAWRRALEKFSWPVERRALLELMGFLPRLADQ